MITFQYLKTAIIKNRGGGGKGDTKPLSPQRSEKEAIGLNYSEAGLDQISRKT